MFLSSDGKRASSVGILGLLCRFSEDDEEELKEFDGAMVDKVLPTAEYDACCCCSGDVCEELAIPNCGLP